MLPFLRQLFSDNRRDGSRMVSSALLVAFGGLLYRDHPLGIVTAAGAGILALAWFLLYLGLEKKR
ncbi:MAG: hypothetical protein OXF25_08050 [Cyanobacteria bacterium MAG CAR3_bin_5]|nr:hypothetical protein [Cyanobacteria bacterium MAG CAR4_bin_6]MCY4173999.1 hypothetical protein [Cyanobacteria bacterium MAG CAR3_bin_5]MCY4236524.1 hypothetical protein [Cyanobacteria bacterium MAG CAR2_bin_4]MCY4331567.1 hypothetical protein [Cyanobacteria bacterium MAG CAR1_bin_15]